MKKKLTISALSINDKLKCLQTLKMNRTNLQVFTYGKWYKIAKFSKVNGTVSLVNDGNRAHSIGEDWIQYFTILDIRKILIKL